ncbi:hypothetical protein [Actinoplanes cyaneus]|uniref:hypothetical protein n=1 Tax=Actinoplanes cyaneus TaxID=52696 RepID=UPI0031DF9CF2
MADALGAAVAPSRVRWARGSGAGRRVPRTLLDRTLKAAGDICADGLSPCPGLLP